MKAPKVKASLIKKYHIITFPYSTLKGLFPPPHNFASLGEAVVVVDMFNFDFSAKILAKKDIRIKIPYFF